MALLDFLKNKKEKDKAKSAKSQRHSGGPVTIPPKADLVGEKKVAAKNEAVALGKFSYNVIKEPHISEKGTILSEHNQYVFKVYKNTNKPEIKKAVEGVYGVNVLAVKIVTIPKKKRRLGRTEGFKKSYKKALVTIKEGQKIEIF